MAYKGAIFVTDALYARLGRLCMLHRQNDPGTKVREACYGAGYNLKERTHLNL